MSRFKGVLEHYKRYGLLDTLNATAAKLSGGIHVPTYPRVLHIELNNTCNLDCKMCPREHLSRPPLNMDFNLYKKIIIDAARLGIPQVRLFLFGEPLLYPRIIEAIRFAKDAGIKHVDLNTNANLLNPKIAQELTQSGLDEIIFSVDGFNKESYESIRIKGNYHKCIDNITYFLELLKSEHKAMTTVIQTINLKQLQTELTDFKVYWEAKVDQVNITELNPIQGLVKELSLGDRSRTTCLEAFYKLVILSNGNVTTCCDDFNGEIKLGSLNDYTISQVWKSKAWKTLRRDFQTLNYADYHICQKCHLSYKVV